MDPALHELMERAGDRVVEAIIRLHGPVPPGVRVVSRFGEFATCRLRAPSIERVHGEDAVVSLKAARRLCPDAPLTEEAAGPPRATDRRRDPGVPTTGRGTVVGIVDWGLDVGHPDFRRPDGSTRVLALWDQRGRHADSPEPWGYGRVHTREHVDKALRDPRPNHRLGYPIHPAGRPQPGTHGTHVASIAAGNGRGGGPMGMAPEADLVFVHLSQGRTGGLGDLGDSVRILEAIDFVFRAAGDRPAVVNLSVGSQGGSHDGLSAVEMALDAAVLSRPGRAVIQSTGNYFGTRAAAAEVLRPGEAWTLQWRVYPGDRTHNELEVWYPGSDVLRVGVVAPDGSSVAVVPLGEQADLTVNGELVGRLYHRRQDPNNGDHHVDCLLRADAPPGVWRIDLEAIDVVDGRCRAWIERDSPKPPNQSVFDAQQATPFGTVGTIANGLRPIAVGAFDPHGPGHPLGSFSSAGPTRDGRQKPDLVAEGVASLAARSGDTDVGRGLTRKSGTSMAAPVVTGAVACMFEAAPLPLTIADTRSILLGTARPRGGDDPRRVGSGSLDALAAVELARRF